ncbi:ribosome modulation factor [Burkholderia vietnamiensis]|uniref:ribosome modulation factor n=1 Tax=Burkholderia vietnamiensis TaxID=60552 RepID=UPI001592DF38|nr:hypothetical protein [Burkholderia vietnamiensis]MBR7998256.1 hypothetical protein [Burkholderia vietnamiensis]MCA7948496.1 hypothetical protein [Burkholderia vietnamiensis]
MKILDTLRHLFSGAETIDNPDSFAYQRGYDDAERGRTENPYAAGSILHKSWQKGYKAYTDYELYVW